MSQALGSLYGTDSHTVALGVRGEGFWCSLRIPKESRWARGVGGIYIRLVRWNLIAAPLLRDWRHRRFANSWAASVREKGLWKQVSGAGERSQVMATCCFRMYSRFDSQHPHGGSQPFVIPVPEILHPLLSSVDMRHTCGVHTHTQTRFSCI